MTVTIENLNGAQIEAVRRYAELHGKKTLIKALRACRRAPKLGAMRKVAEAFSRLSAGGFFGPWHGEP